MTKNATNINSSAPESGNSDLTQPQRRFTFSKKERLYGKKTFDILFEQGKSFKEGPLRFVYTFDLPEYFVRSPLMIAVGAPKRRFKHAVQRNLIKRKLREAVRLNKHPLQDILIEKDKNLAILITYNSQKIPNFHLLNQAVIAGFARLAKMV